MSEPGLTEQELMSEFMKHRAQIHAYAIALTRDYHLAEDCVQEVAITLTRRRRDYDPSRPFVAWALGICRRQALATLRAHRGSAEILLDDEALQRLAEALARLSAREQVDRRLGALGDCLGALEAGDLEVLRHKYEAGRSAEAIAQLLNRSRVAVNSVLQRLRARLSECVERRLRLEANQ